MIVYYIINQRIQRQREKNAPRVTDVGARKDINEILQSALTLNSRFDIRLEGTNRELFCVFRDIDKNFLILELPAKVKASRNWIGRKVEGFFKFRPPGQKLQFYKFESSVQDIIPASVSQLIALQIPASLRMEQKRQHLRLEVPLSYIKKFEVRPFSFDEKGHLYRNVQKFGDVIWRHDPEAVKQVFNLMDISGGGLRVRVDARELEGGADFIKSNPSLVITMEFIKDPDQSDDLELFHVVCRVRKHYYDGMGNHVLGMQFTHKARLDPETQAIANWEQVSLEEGVEDITTWVVKTHIRLYREKGLT